ncbi:hypothetical protein AMC87_CH01086 [Rhizobium phaseoli]|uniref:hypothetical protein n=1 Tax=Rhizobium phaseoli TaxID=396 RepID=UPI0007F13FE2|nr:hypothetical protein [Rhizobium phaseoli]ANL45811.1 hypothetical protein AMC87_CH01086 [Rhizobium phaseoli]PWI55256.1 hypothetical protein B5K03_04970 [Rhizobium phaseoli]
MTWKVKIPLLILGCLLAMSGVLFRSFWLSEWGMPTFIVLVWLIMSLAFGWGGNGKAYSLRFGFICGSGIALVFLATGYIHRYAGFALMFALLSLGIKTKFFERRWR